MKQTSSRDLQNGLNYVNPAYGFLLERGYEAVSSGEAFVGWQVELRKADLLMKLERTKGDEYISFRAATQPSEEFFDLGSVVYAATGEIIPLSFDSHVKELQQYLDRIEAYFAGEYLKNPAGLQAAEVAYRETLPKGEDIPPVEVVTRRETRIIPILYYPLLVIVLLLIFGALTTLYMVLLERLVSSFSPDAEAYIPFIAAGALLLATGSMLLLRRWVKLV